MRKIRYQIVRLVALALRVPADIHPTFWMRGMNDFNVAKCTGEPDGSAMGMCKAPKHPDGVSTRTFSKSRLCIKDLNACLGHLEDCQTAGEV